MKEIENLVKPLQVIQLLEPGVHFNIPFKYYLQLPYVSKSYLSKLDYCPAYAHLPTKTTDALKFGRALHSFVMEPELFKEEFYSIDSMLPATSSIGRRQRANAILDNMNKEMIPATGKDSLETLVGMKSSILKHPTARRLFADCWFEVTLVWDHVLPNGSKIRMKARPDAIPKRIKKGVSGAVVDLKSARDASMVGFLRAVVEFGYHIQDALYLDALNILFKFYQSQGREWPFPSDFDTFIFVAVEKDSVYRCECHELTAQFRELGQSEYHRLLEVERSCRDAKGGPVYPAYRNAGISTLDLPAYLRPQL